MTSKLLSLITLGLIPWSLWADTTKPISKIAFGSCAHQDKPLPILKAITAERPDLFLALGDNIYADTSDMQVMWAKYQKLGALEDYKQLTKLCPILATWDDHDYGKNDAGVEFAKKEEAQQLLLDFYGVPKDSPRRTQKGIYYSQIFGPVGKRVQVILLDTRYFRSPLKRGKREADMNYTPYIPNSDPDATMLGAQQWTWLEQQLKMPAEVRLLVSSIQVVPEDHGFEKWTNLPLERERLYNLIKQTRANGVICLSGDRHLAELSMSEKAVGYPLYDLTSSGLNQADKNWRPLERNRHRVATMPFGDNFGLIQIDWQEDPKISLQIRDVDGDVTIQHKIYLSLLQQQEAVAFQAKKESSKNKDEQPKPSEGAISAKDALEKVGQKVTVEMKVLSAGSSGKLVFLNSEKNRRDKSNFTIVVTEQARKAKWKDADQNTFNGKIIRVTGTVELYKDTPQIKLDKDEQLELVEEKKKQE